MPTNRRMTGKYRYLTISRWERDEKPIDPNAMAIIRLQAIERLGLGSCDSIEMLMKKSERIAPPPDMCFNPEDNHYVRNVRIAA